MGEVAAGLFGPVGLALARAEERLPGSRGLPGGLRFELKWDGFRTGAVCRGGQVRLWSRNGKDFTAKFPDVQEALMRQVDVDCVLDGELVVWTGEHLDFDALQQRMVNTAATVRTRLAPTQPASFIAFDVLAVDSVDIRPMRWTARRRRLESLAENWRPPLQLSPITDDPAEAREWLDAFKARGVEGLVVKGASTRYQPGRRDWIKVNSVGLRVVRFSFDAWMCLVSVLRRTGSWCATGVADGRPVPLRSLGNRSAGLPVPQRRVGAVSGCLKVSVSSACG